MTAITFFSIPTELFENNILPRLGEHTLLLMLVSKVTKKYLEEILLTPKEDLTLDGTTVEVTFTGTVKQIVAAYFQHRMKASALHHYPALLEELANTRKIMKCQGNYGPYTVQDFLDYTTGRFRTKKIVLSLIPFDFKTQQLSKDTPCSQGIPSALIDAVKKDSIELVNLVLAHPKAKDLSGHLLGEILLFDFTDMKIRSSLLAHPNAIPKNILI